jgi:opacity protein-like surface antigen
MRHATLLAMVIFVTTSTVMYAQNTVAVQYAISFPLGKTADFIDGTSFRGATFDYRHHISPNLAIGAGIGWYAFYEKKDYDTYTTNDQRTSVSGLQRRYINSVPVVILADYYFGASEDNNLMPFVGLGIGTTYNRQDIAMGVYDSKVNSWHFTLAPEAGLKYHLKERTYLNISARYNSSFKTDELDEQSYATLNLGFLFDL